MSSYAEMVEWTVTISSPRIPGFVSDFISMMDRKPEPRNSWLWIIRGRINRRERRALLWTPAQRRKYALMEAARLKRINV